MFMYGHVTTYLLIIQTVIPYLYQAHQLETDDMEYKYIQGIITAIHQRSLQYIISFVYQRTYQIHHPETHQGRYRQIHELIESAAPIHVCIAIYREQQHNDETHWYSPPSVFEQMFVAAEQKSATEEEYPHHITVSALHKIDDTQSLTGFPAT